MQRPFHDRGVTDDPAFNLDHEVCPAQGMLPVFLGEAAVLILGEGRPKQIPDLRDLSCAQLLGWQEV
jgi:hypothetical protein